MQKQSSTSTYIILGVIVLAALGLYFYYEGEPNDDATSSLESIVDPGTEEARLVGSRVMSLLQQINSLKIDDTIFQSAAYQSLRDYTVTIPPQNVGRPNPFAPISGQTAASSAQLPGTAR